MRQSNMFKRGHDPMLGLAVGFDMFSVYKADVDISSHKSIYYERKLKLYLHAKSFEEDYFEEKFVFEFLVPTVLNRGTEFLVPTGLYRRMFRNSAEGVVIHMESGNVNIFIDELLRFVKGGYARYPTQTEFMPNHSDVPVLI